MTITSIESVNVIICRVVLIEMLYMLYKLPALNHSPLFKLATSTTNQCQYQYISKVSSSPTKKTQIRPDNETQATV